MGQRTFAPLTLLRQRHSMFEIWPTSTPSSFPNGLSYFDMFFSVTCEPIRIQLNLRYAFNGLFTAIVITSGKIAQGCTVCCSQQDTGPKRSSAFLLPLRHQRSNTKDSVIRCQWKPPLSRMPSSALATFLRDDAQRLNCL